MKIIGIGEVVWDCFPEGRGYHCAGLELQQAIQNYRWAVAGAAVSVS